MKTHSKTQDKKRQILESALGCFVEKGIEQTNIQMICTASNTSVGSLYHHFGNKEAIAAAVYIEGMRDFWQLVDVYLNKLPENASAESLVKSLVYANVDWINKNKQWASFIFQNRSAVKTQVQKQNLDETSKLFYQRLESLVMAYVQQKQIKQMPIKLYSSIIVGPVHDYARHYLSGRYKESLSKHKEYFADAAWSAVRMN